MLSGAGERHRLEPCATKKAGDAWSSAVLAAAPAARGIILFRQGMFFFVGANLGFALEKAGKERGGDYCLFTYL